MAKRYERFDALQAELGKAGEADTVEQDATGEDAVDDAATKGAERYAKVLDEEGNEQPLDADDGEPQEETAPELYTIRRSMASRDACFIQSPPQKPAHEKAEPSQPVRHATRGAAVSAGEDDIEQYEIQGEDAQSDGVQNGEQQCEEVEEMDEDLEELRPPSSEDQRSPEELEAIQYEILELESEIQIAKRYKIIDRLGEGTFSAVYKAIDCNHPFYNNTKWQSSSGASAAPKLPSLQALRQSSVSNPRSSRSSSSTQRDSPYYNLLAARKHLKSLSSNKYSLTRQEGGSPVYVALKRIYVTSSPQRIQNELDILADLRSARCTAYLVEALRHEDQVIAVMPYEKHQDFRTYYRTLPLSSMRCYLRCLFAALADCHGQGIMHRDVKPANFLFNVETNSGTLCDFGLAQRLNPAEWHARCLHSLPELWKRYLDPGAAVHGTKLARPVDLLTQVDESFNNFFDNEDVIMEEVQKRTGEEQIVGPWVPTLGYVREKHLEGLTHGKDNKREIREIRERIRKENWKENWAPALKQPSTAKVGYMKPEYDRRPQIRANRAGTRGFRAPEVVLKCPDQTMALDIWSVGVTLLCFLTRRFPFFASNDDTEALMEIAAIFGKKGVEKCAAVHNRTFITNIPTIEHPRFRTLHELVRALNPNIFVENMPRLARSSMALQYGECFTTDPETIRNLDHSGWYKDGADLWLAVDLMKRCLTLDLTKRITAHDALDHPFLAESSA